jgi:hypothetical protein
MPSFGSQPLPLHLWTWLLLGGVMLFVVVELEKFLVRLLFQKRP